MMQKEKKNRGTANSYSETCERVVPGAIGHAPKKNRTVILKVEPANARA
jgi:hypothetical protein